MFADKIEKTVGRCFQSSRSGTYSRPALNLYIASYVGGGGGQIYGGRKKWKA